MPLTTSLFAAVFQNANLQDLPIENVPQKRKKEVYNNDEEEESNNNIPLKKMKIQKEDNNKLKQRKQKKSIYHYLSGDVKRKWSILGRVINMTEERRLQWAKVWCNRTRTTCPLISSEDEFDNDDFEMCEQLIQDQIVLQAKMNLEKVSGKKLTSTTFGSSSSSSNPSTFEEEIEIEISEEATEMNSNAILDEALADLS
jgi:hypothetical protein